MLNFIIIAVVVIALTFDFINGFHDTANSIATSVSTRVLSPRQAIIMAAVLNFVGALISENVAKTISSGIINIGLEQYVIIAALLARHHLGPYYMVSGYPQQFFARIDRRFGRSLHYIRIQPENCYLARRTG